jgi:dipeptidyl aminopeptidase/acylaminoacyl peptidase
MRLFTSVNSNCPPTLLVHGTADALVPYGLSQSFARELQEAGVFTRLLTLQDAPHTAIGHSDVIIEQIEKFMKDDCDLT